MTIRVGFVSPPGWFDPAPSEFRELTDGKIQTQQVILDLPEFDWQLDSIAATEDLQVRSAIQLSAAGCQLTAITGTPFGWSGMDSVESVYARNRRIAKTSGVPHLSPASAILDWLREQDVRRIGLACTYYSRGWSNAWQAFMQHAGFDAVIHSFIDDGWMPEDESTNADFWDPTAAQILQSVRNFFESKQNLEAIVISGSGARTLGLLPSISRELDIPIIGSDTALYWSVARHLEIDLEIV